MRMYQKLLRGGTLQAKKLVLIAHSLQLHAKCIQSSKANLFYNCTILIPQVNGVVAHIGGTQGGARLNTS